MVFSYNFMLAFVICAIGYLVGEAVSNITKAWIPSVFVTAVVFLIGFWTIVPNDVVGKSNLIPFGSSTGIYLLLVHMGTVISLKQLAAQWKTIVACLAGLAGMCALSLLVAQPIIGRDMVIAGLPPLTGGIVAATTMQQAATEAGLPDAALFAIAMYCVQGFAGYPITAICLQIEGRKLLKNYKSGSTMEYGKMDEINGKIVEETAAPKKKLIPPMPAKWNGPVMILCKLGLVAYLATVLGATPIFGYKLSGAVWALILGIIFTTIGFLDENSLTKSNSYGIVMFALMMYIFDGLKDATPQQLGSIVGPMVILIVIGVVGMGILVFVAAKILKMDFPLAMATALTALYGFPPNAVITENTCTALAEGDEDKKAFLMGEMFAPMIVGGFTTVTITSVIIAGIFANMF